MDVPCDKFVPGERTCRVGRNMALWCRGCRFYWPDAHPSDRHVIMWMENVSRLHEWKDPAEFMTGGAE